MKYSLILLFCLTAAVCVTIHTCHRTEQDKKVKLPEISYSVENIDNTVTEFNGVKESTQIETKFDIWVDLDKAFEVIRILNGRNG